MSDILPQSHFDYLKEQRGVARENQLINQDQINNIIVAQEVNKAFNAYAQNKDGTKFVQQMRTLGHLFGNEKLQGFEMPDYMGEMGQPVYTMDDAGALTKNGVVPKNAIIRNKSKESDAARLTSAVQSGMQPDQLRVNFPQYADKIDQLEMAGIFQQKGVTGAQGAQIPPFSMPQGQGLSQPGMSVEPGMTPVNGGIVPTGWDALGRPKGYEREKPDLAKMKFEADQAATKLTDEKRIENEQEFSADLLSTIGEIKKGIKYFGAAGSVPPLPGEYSKVNWRANFDKLISQQVLETLSDLKKQSKTGATGFGQLSNKELGILMNAATVLKRNMSEEDAMRYLNDMEAVTRKISGGGRPSSSTGGNFEEGKVYRDAQGNRAVFQGGRWVEAQ